MKTNFFISGDILLAFSKLREAWKKVLVLRIRSKMWKYVELYSGGEYIF